MNSLLQPKTRSALRLWIGKRLYRYARYAYWYLGRVKWAKEKEGSGLTQCLHLCAQHSTLMLRPLAGADMVYQHNKVENLRLATSCIDGIILRPGETLSYWRLIGEPTARKGYKEGIMLFCGSFYAGVGGGLCQLSNLIFWMTLHTPLSIVERYRHSYDVFPDINRTQPFGSGATCVYPYRDLMIRNDTQDTYVLRLNVGKTHLEGAWYSSAPQKNSYQVIERNHCMRAEPWGGYSRHNELYRQEFSPEGNLIDEHYITENHALMMYSPFLENGES